MFIYVMDSESKDILINCGFELLKVNDKQTIWVFVNKPELNFSSINIPCVLSDVLTF